MFAMPEFESIGLRSKKKSTKNKRKFKKKKKIEEKRETYIQSYKYQVLHMGRWCCLTVISHYFLLWTIAHI